VDVITRAAEKTLIGVEDQISTLRVDESAGETLVSDW
jgi:hypothetical protein